MPKLNTTADKIQLTTNLINSTNMSSNKPLSSWSDSQYPSAQVLYRTYQSLSASITNNYNNITSRLGAMNTAISQKGNPLDAYPVGSVYISSKTTTTPFNGYNLVAPEDPASELGGGTWELIDMHYRSTYIPMKLQSGCWTKTKSALRDDAYIKWEGNTIHLHLGLFIDKSTKITDSANTILGTINLKKIGLTESETLIHTIHAVCFSEVGNAVALCEIAQNGVVKLLDVIGAGGATSMVTNNDTYTSSVIMDVVIYVPLL